MSIETSQPVITPSQPAQTSSPIIKYFGFSPDQFGDAVIGVERISDIHASIRRLHHLHYAETETLYLSDPFNPDYDRYIQQEKVSQFILFTVRINSTLVGYLQYYVFRDMHTQGVYQAREDAFFLTEEVRGKGIAPKLLAYAEDALKQLGCKYVGMSSKAPVGGPDIGPFLEKRGYKPVALFYAKQLEE